MECINLTNPTTTTTTTTTTSKYLWFSCSSSKVSFDIVLLVLKVKHVELVVLYVDLEFVCGIVS